MPLIGEKRMGKRSVFVDDALWAFAQAEAVGYGVSTSAYIRLLLDWERRARDGGRPTARVLSEHTTTEE